MKRKYSQEEVWERMYGRIYFNKDDTNMFVRRKSIATWTMNLGNKWVWIIQIPIAIIAVVIGCILAWTQSKISFKN